MAAGRPFWPNATVAYATLDARDLHVRFDEWGDGARVEPVRAPPTERGGNRYV